MQYRQLLLEISVKGKHSISDEDKQFSKYKELANQGLIKLEQIKNTGVYEVTAK